MNLSDEGGDDPMNDRLDDLEALAAYLAGGLDDDARQRIDDRLEVDESAQADLALLQQVDGLLAALPSPEPPDDARTRLHAALEPVMADVIGTGTQAARASLRGRIIDWFGSGSMAPRLAAGAAAFIVIAGVGVGLTQIGGRGSADLTTTEAALPLAEAGEDALEDSAGGAPAAGLGQAIIPGDPVVDEATARALLDRFAGTSRAAAPEAAPEQLDTDGDGTDGAASTTNEDAAFGDVDQCADKPLESGPGQQVYAEVTTYEDEPAIVYVIERPDGGQEVWVVAQTDCGLLFWAEAE